MLAAYAWLGGVHTRGKSLQSMQGGGGCGDDGGTYCTVEGLVAEVCSPFGE